MSEINLSLRGSTKFRDLFECRDTCLRVDLGGGFKHSLNVIKHVLISTEDEQHVLSSLLRMLTGNTVPDVVVAEGVKLSENNARKLMFGISFLFEAK